MYAYMYVYVGLTLLRELAPTHVVLYDAEPALVRAIEVKM